jgi:serine protease Do
MKRRLTTLAVIFGLMGTVALLSHPFDWKFEFGRGPRPLQAHIGLDAGLARAQSAEEGLEILRSQSKAFVAIAKKVLPSVVSITSEKTVQNTSIPNTRNFQFFGDPLFDHFFQSPEKVPQVGSGSGVIVSKDGYILTNNHVVADADRIKVSLEDGKSYDGELVGRDPKTDVAVIRVKTKGEDLTPIQMGDSEKLEVGEWVLAVGNPFQLSSTVTQGIVSAVGRSHIGLADYEDFIQTDAAINPGNSGGALVNLDGELVGINTAIASRTGGSMGVGFAIPVNMAHKIMQDLITNGKVTRGWLGIRIQNLNDDMAEVFGLDKPRGALVQGVESGSPGDKAGLRQGDLIVAMDGRQIKDTEELRLRVTDRSPGTKVELAVMRDKKEITIPVKLGELDSDTDKTAALSGGPDRDRDRSSDLGLTVDELDAQTRRELNLPRGTAGVVVSDTDPSKPAGRAGLQRGDVILRVGDTPVETVRDFRQALRDTPSGKPVLLLINRDGNEIFLGVRMPEE